MLLAQHAGHEPVGCLILQLVDWDYGPLPMGGLQSLEVSGVAAPQCIRCRFGSARLCPLWHAHFDGYATRRFLLAYRWSSTVVTNSRQHD